MYHRTITKAELASSLCSDVGLSKKEAILFVESFFETFKKCFARGESVKLSGFGHFDVREKHKRRGRNPKTGQDMEITQRRVVTFKHSQVLRERINQNF